MNNTLFTKTYQYITALKPTNTNITTPSVATATSTTTVQTSTDTSTSSSFMPGKNAWTRGISGLTWDKPPAQSKPIQKVVAPNPKLHAAKENDANNIHPALHKQYVKEGDCLQGEGMEGTSKFLNLTAVDDNTASQDIEPCLCICLLASISVAEHRHWNSVTSHTARHASPLHNFCVLFYTFSRRSR